MTVEPSAVDPHCFDADPDPDPAQNIDADPDPDPAKNVHPPWQNPRYAPGSTFQHSSTFCRGRTLMWNPLFFCLIPIPNCSRNLAGSETLLPVYGMLLRLSCLLTGRFEKKVQYACALILLQLSFLYVKKGCESSVVHFLLSSNVLTALRMHIP